MEFLPSVVLLLNVFSPRETLALYVKPFGIAEIRARWGRAPSGDLVEPRREIYSERDICELQCVSQSKSRFWIVIGCLEH